MGQFRPSSLIPSTLTSDYTIDATVDNVFRCKINGTSPTTKYRLTIMQNNTESTQVYDSGLQTLSTPLYPKNYDGTDNELEVTVPSTSGMINGGEYKWKIASYWTDTDYYESFDNVFMAYAATLLSIDTFPNPITQKQYTFSATITQTQNVGVERFGWIIRNASTQEVLIDTISSNNIYSADIRVYYDGFLNNTNYEIRACVWMMDGTTVETEFQPISVSYNVEPFESVVTAKQTKDSGVLVQWSNIYYVFGTPTNDDYSYELTYPWSDEFTNVYLNLKSGNSLTYSQSTGQPISLPTTITHTICFRCEQNNASVYRANGTDSSGSDYYIEVSYADGVVYLDINGTKSVLYTMTDVDKFLTLQIQQNQVVIKRMIGNLDGLYPSETLYPSDDLFPHDETYSYVDTTVSISGIIPDGTFDEFILSGPSLLRYFWIRTTPIPNNIFAKLGSGSYLPEWDSDTRILATFQNTLSAGNAQSSSEVVGWLVYRLDEDTTNLKFIRMNEPERNYLVDYGAKNQVSVIYYVFPSFETEIGLPNMSELFTPSWWSWDLIVCDTYGDDQYYVAETHKFDLNVTSNQMTNNTSYSALTNFTPYAKIQSSYSNYWTGTLTALLGNCDITYHDTVEEMNRIKALANDNRDKFLKDRKGNIWKVRLSAPVGEQVTDAYVEQAVTVSLTWSEVGSAENSSVTEPLTMQVEDIIVEGCGVAGGVGNYTLQSKTVEPTKKQQNITPDSGYYGLSDVTVGAIPVAYQDVTNVTATAEGVLTGQVFVSSEGEEIAGTMPNNGGTAHTLDTATTSYTIPEGYHNGEGTVSITTQTKNATPTKSQQTISADTGKVLSSVTVAAIPAAYQDVSGVTVTAGQMLTGAVAVGSDGTKITGTMANNGATNLTIDGLSSTSVSIPAGYTTGGTVSLTSDIEDALAAI